MASNQQLALLDPLEAPFVDWLRGNPVIVEAFRQAAVEWYRAGNDRCSAKMLAEVIRWKHGLTSRDSDGYKVNNNWTSRLGRHVVATTPELPADFFETRVLRADRERADTAA